MTKTQRLMQIAVVALALLAPATAFASGPVHDALAGTVLDPLATTVKVVPPRGGAVMVYRNGQLKGAFLQPGLMTVQPGRVYGVVATRGNYMVFNAGVMMRDGFTELAWRDGSTLPVIAWTPAYHQHPYRVAAYGHDVHHDHHAHARPASRQPVERRSHTSAAATKPQAAKKLVNHSQRRRVLRSVKTRVAPSKRVSSKAVRRPLQLKSSALRNTRVAAATH